MPDVRQRHSSSSACSQISRVSRTADHPMLQTEPPPDGGHRTSTSGHGAPITGSDALRLRPTVRHGRARPGSLLSASCRTGPSDLVGTRHARFVPALLYASIAPPAPTAGFSAPLKAVVAIASVPPVLHGGSAAPPASPPRGPHSEVRASIPASSVPHVATANPYSSALPSPLPATQQPEPAGCRPVPSGFSLSRSLAPLPNPACSGLAALAADARG